MIRPFLEHLAGIARVGGGLLLGHVGRQIARGSLEFGRCSLDRFLLFFQSCPALSGKLIERFVLGFLGDALPKVFLKPSELFGRFTGIAAVRGGLFQIAGQAIEFTGGFLLILGGLVQFAFFQSVLGVLRVLGI